MKDRNVFGLMLSVMLLLLAAGSSLAEEAEPGGYPAASGVNVDPAATAPWFIETVDAAMGVGQHVSVAIDPDSDTTYISYYDATNKNLKMAKYVGSGGNCGSDNAWSCETVDDSSSDVGKYTSIAIDPTTNLPVIAYWNKLPSQLKLATAHMYGWDIITVEASLGRYASLKIDSSGAAHIAYHRSDVIDYLKYARRVGGGAGNCGGNDYQCDTIDTSDQQLGVYPSLALDGSGQPRIAYYDRGKMALMYAYQNGGTWMSREILPTASGQYASLDVDVNNGDLPHIAHYDPTSGKLVYAVYVESNGNCGFQGSWQCDEIDSMGIKAHTRDVSLAVDKAGLPIIAYHTYIDGDPLPVVTFNLARPAAALGLQSGNCGPQNHWQCDRIPDSGHSGDYSAIAVSPSGLATIAYYNSESSGILRVAYQRSLVFLPLVMKKQ